MIALETLFVEQYVELEDQDGNKLVAQIQEIGDNTFQIGSIISKHRVSIPGLLKHEVFVFFRGESGDRYQFKTRVISQPDNTPPKLQLAIPSDEDVLRVQQREYFRVPAVINFEIEDSLGGTFLPLETYDISGGGLSFVGKEPLHKEGDVGLRGKLYIVNGEDVNSIPFVARTANIRQWDNGKYQTAMEFTEIRESHRDNIIKFCMKEQLKRRLY